MKEQMHRCNRGQTYVCHANCYKLQESFAFFYRQTTFLYMFIHACIYLNWIHSTYFPATTLSDYYQFRSLRNYFREKESRNIDAIGRFLIEFLSESWNFDKKGTEKLVNERKYSTSTITNKLCFTVFKQLRYRDKVSRTYAYIDLSIYPRQ